LFGSKCFTYHAVVQSNPSLLMLQEVIHSKKLSKASEYLIFE